MAPKLAPLGTACGDGGSSLTPSGAIGRARRLPRRVAAVEPHSLRPWLMPCVVLALALALAPAPSGCLAGRDAESAVVGPGPGPGPASRRADGGAPLSSSAKSEPAAPAQRVAASAAGRPHPRDGSNSSRRKRPTPNIVLFVTDDQDVELGSLNFMPETGRLMREGGAEFRHAYATTPMCCPSRSSMLTGLYVHNHHVYTNNDNCSNTRWRVEHESRSFAAYLHAAGYHTGYFGKYLNKYNGSHIPVGWQEWAGLIMNSKYYNYSINFNGKRIRHGNDYTEDYYTDLIANDSINFLRRWKSAENTDKPVLLVMSFPAPHGPEDSAPQFSNMFFNVTSHHTPSYDYAPNPDKQWILRVTEKMLPVHKRFTDLLMTKRLQTLQSVDNAVRRVFDVLKETSELENTYTIYTSDHGYHLGQFGLIKGKSFPFEFDVRIPFLVRGPGIEPGSIINEIALNIDLAPTILELADVQIPNHMDGRSLKKLFNKRKNSARKYLTNWPDTFLIESSGRRDILAPVSNLLSNKISFGVSESAKNDVKFRRIRSIENGSSGIFVSSKAQRLSTECQQTRYSYPCAMGQKWYCVQKQNRWRKHKCRVPSQTINPKFLQKCTCLTGEGIVYLRFQAMNKQRWQNGDVYSVPRTIIHYLKSNNSSDELVNELAKTWQIMRRHRRSSGKQDYQSDVSASGIRPTTPAIDLVDGRMIEFPQNEDKSNSTTCMVLYDGSVRCSPEVYENPILLQLGKEQLILEIRKLQLQIEKLKNIHRYLERKHASYTNASNNFNKTNADSANSSSQDDLKTHKHRHQHSDSIRDSNRTAHLQPRDHRNQKNGFEDIIPDACYCIPYSLNEFLSTEEESAVNSWKQLLRNQKKKKKEKKLKKKTKFEKECFQEKMNCFTHDNQHWKTQPFWNDDPFCFCMNANNNTYTCLRTINTTHNSLYCEFVTGWITYYNLRIDPFQQWNRFSSLSKHEKVSLKSTLAQLSKCKGSEECGFRSNDRQILNVESEAV